LAVMATTFSIVAVFVPVAFMGGIIGRFFFEFGMTVAFAVLVSLLVSFTLTPMLSAWWGVEPHQEATGVWAVLTRPVVAFNNWFERVADRYRGVVEWALTRRKRTLGLAALAFVGAFMLFPMIGGGFMPETDEGMFSVTFETPEGSSLEYTRRKAEEIDAAIRSQEGVDYTYTTIGAGATGTVTAGEVFVSLVELGERPSQNEVMATTREKLARIYGVKTSVLPSGGLGGPQKPIQANVKGPDVDELQRISAQLA